MRPDTERELAEIVRDAFGPLEIKGGGTRDIGNPVVGESISTAGLTGIELYDPGSLTLVAKAGTLVADIQSTLAENGQMLAFEPLDYRALLGTTGESTIGGVVATNASGPRRISAGACRDFLLGVRFIDGRGTVIKNGGRVMKNVTGYDLVKLMAGSFGTLGILSEVAFKVLPMTDTEMTLVFRGFDPKRAVAALSQALGSPFSVTGAAHLDFNGQPKTCIRLEGTTASVRYRGAALQTLLGGQWDMLGAEESRDLWTQVRDVIPFADQSGSVWRVSLKPTDAPKMTDALVQAGLDFKAIYDWGGGLVWLLVQDAGDGGSRPIRQQMTAFNGHATLVRADAEIRKSVQVFQPEHSAIAAISKGLRGKFDPRGILNPGRMT